MTNEHISSFVGDLVQMAKAFEELPNVMEALEIERTMSDEKSQRIQQLELRIIDLKNANDEKLSMILTLEASRDDAELRFLFAEERTASALAFVRSTFGSAGALIQALDPKAEAKVVEPDSPALHEITTGESVNPLPNAGSGSSDTFLARASSTSSQGSSPEAYYESMPPALHEVSPTIAEPLEDISAGFAGMHGEWHPDVRPEGQGQPVDETLFASVASEVGESADDPTVHTSTDTELPQGSTTAEPAETTSQANGPYSGLCYFDVPGYLTLTEWLAGGGTEALYFNRRTA